MSDLISRQEAIATAISGRVRTLPTTEDGEDWIRVSEVRESLYAVPSAEPQIIRCKDCKYYGRVDKRSFYRGGDCTKGIISTIVPDKDFCKNGERKES